jgi:hypothetical protein
MPRLLLTLVLLGLTLGHPGAALAQAPTPPPAPRLTAVSPGRVALKDALVARFDGLAPWLAANPSEARRLVLFLDGRELSDVEARWGPENELAFTLTRGAESRNAWAALLGRPALTPRAVRVQAGVKGAPPFPGVATIALDTLNGGYLAVAAAAFGILLVFFVMIARTSDLLREGSIPPAAGDRRPFSLGRTQMAVWFFVVVASFVFIWIVTGSHDPLTASVLALVGLSAGTALSAAVIDANKDAAVENKGAALEAERQRIETELAALRTSKTELERSIATAPAGVDTAPLRERLVRGEAEIAARLQRRPQIDDELRAVAQTVQPLTSQGFWRDVLSDQNGVSFHRFQIAVWTIVLTVIFAYTVYDTLGMPDFDAKLLGLMGISSGTYLGFKFPEVK